MKTSEIAKKYGFNVGEFNSFLYSTNQEYTKSAFTGDRMIADDKVDQIVARYKKYSVLQEYAKKNNIDEKEFQAMCSEYLDSDVDAEQLVTEYEQKKEYTLNYETERSAALPKILVTSGYNFEGYRIVKYSGYISGDDAVQVDRGTESFWFGGGATDVGTELMKSLTVIRRNALRELKEAAYDLGCNAIIGVDFDYMTLDPQTANSTGGTTYLPYVFGVTANGTAVKIEKIEE